MARRVVHVVQTSTRRCAPARVVPAALLVFVHADSTMSEPKVVCIVGVAGFIGSHL